MSSDLNSSILACHLVLSLRSQTDPAHVNRDVYPLSDSVGSTRVFNVSNIKGRSVNSSRAVIGLPDLEKGVESEEGHIPEACEHPTPNGTSEVHVNPHKNLSRNYI